MVASGVSVEELKQIMVELDFSEFEDQPPAFKHFKELGEAYGLIFKDGIFRGDFLHNWILETWRRRVCTPGRTSSKTTPGARSLQINATS